MKRHRPFRSQPFAIISDDDLKSLMGAGFRVWSPTRNLRILAS